ncbi:hypothetical protein WY02_11330 [Pseudonocardia sp. AL041005-10]|nr:hypothetical protein [Pseudonocardia sp. AL041005-10]ALE78923.1 hypothetical protein WY02_11330 [Pseudonocardia sp. AL041005-10]
MISVLRATAPDGPERSSRRTAGASPSWSTRRAPSPVTGTVVPSWVRVPATDSVEPPSSRVRARTSVISGAGS